MTDYDDYDTDAYCLSDANAAETVIEARIISLLREAEDDFDELREYMEEVEEDYSDDIYEFAFRAAVSWGKIEYMKQFSDEVELDDGTGECSYFSDAKDEDTRSWLIELGAPVPLEDYYDCRFAMETMNNEIIAFDEKFREEVFKKYLNHIGMPREKFMVCFEDEDQDGLEDVGIIGDVNDDLNAMFIEIEDGEISFMDIEYEDGSEAKDLLETLGYEMEFVGQEWKLESSGVYYIK